MSETPKASSPSTVLVADDDRHIRTLLEYTLQKNGFQVVLAEDGRQALDAMTEEIHVALIDLRMPHVGGIECLEQIHKGHPDTQVIIITANTELKEAVEAMKRGAFDYITKPFNPEELAQLVRKAAHTSNLTRENRQLRASVGDLLPRVDFIGNSDVAEDLRQRAHKIAGLDSTVLISGPSGAGKGVLARLIHHASPRARGGFITVNCTALPRDLVESELFGHERGAFTGATDRRMGRVEMADGGTLFLDEIGEMPLELQPKLLTFLQDHSFQRIGGNKELRADVRVIAATNRDLRAMIAERAFREDLFYRLNVLTLDVPSLAHRREDIDPLSEHLLNKIALRRQVPGYSLTPEARATMLSHDWPGNVRELENVLERASAFCENLKISDADLRREMAAFSPESGRITAPEPSAGLAGRTLEQIEREAIEQTLAACGGNKSRAAQQLGISEKSIYNKMSRLGLR